VAGRLDGGFNRIGESISRLQPRELLGHEFDIYIYVCV